MTDQPVTKKKPTTAERLDSIVEMVSYIGENQLQMSWRLELLESAQTAPPKPPSFFDERVWPTLLFARKHWLTIIIICWIALHYFPFVEGTARLRNLLPSRNPLVQKLDINGIVSQSPNDKAERRILATEYRNTADSIKNGTITTKLQAETAIWNQAQNVWLSKDWEATYHNLKKATDPINDLESFADKLYEIADAFERASK